MLGSAPNVHRHGTGGLHLQGYSFIPKCQGTLVHKRCMQAADVDAATGHALRSCKHALLQKHQQDMAMDAREHVSNAVDGLESKMQL